MGRILGLDIGMKRTGVAVTDPARIIVTGLETQPTDKLMDFLHAYVAREPVDAIIVGYPFLDEAWGDPAFRAFLDKTIAAIRKAFPALAVELQDERFSSVQAREILVMSGKKKKDRRNKAQLDRTSAILILQTYLGHV
jgi:putative Holliday junction resolvase